MRRWRALYASALVEEVVCCVRVGRRGFNGEESGRHEGATRLEKREVKVRLAAIAACLIGFPQARLVLCPKVSDL